MQNTFFSRMTWLLSLVLVAGCATSPHAPSGKPGEVSVLYSRDNGAGRTLKRDPEAIRIIRREHVRTEVGKQVGLNILLLALGGVSVNTFDRGDLDGSPLLHADTQQSVANPVFLDYPEHVSTWVNTWMREKGIYANSTFANPILVGHGFVRLTYADSTDEEQREQFRLRTDMAVYKRKESASVLTITPVVRVDCSETSEEKMTEMAWAKDDYAPLKATLAQTLQRCDDKVAQALPDMLGR